MSAATGARAQDEARFTAVEFWSRDGLLITADYYARDRPDAPVVILFHQSEASRGEFRDIAPRLNEMGFHALAVDLRWGGKDRWHRVDNETARRNGTEALVAAIEGGRASPWPTIFQSYQDMEAALEWTRGKGLSGPRLVLGSSFSAILAFRMASEHEEVAAVLSFSPAEYFEKDTTMVRGWAEEMSVPVFIGAGVDEEGRVWPVYRALGSRRKEMILAPAGSHGASMLMEDEAAWGAFADFLRSLGREAGSVLRR
ncbi:MAG TPA: alpha/beta hydrolase [Longimicrobiales bacterium]